MEQPGSPFRILCLDGGGSKGVYSLGVLREVEATCKKPLCEVFDLIYGTSTGAIIASLVGLGKSISDIENIYFSMIPVIMSKSCSANRSRALREEASKIYGDLRFDAFKTHIGVVTANIHDERPMIFKSHVRQAHGSKATFKPGFGCTIAEAVVASGAAYPLFERVTVKTENQGEPLLMDGGFVANNPTLFALADAREAFQKDDKDLRVLSVGVGQYLEPKATWKHKFLFKYTSARLILKMLTLSSATIDQLRRILFPLVHTVRINDSNHQPEYATDLMEYEVSKLRMLHAFGRKSFSDHEKEISPLFI